MAIEGIEHTATFARSATSKTEQEAGQLIIQAASRNAEDFVLERTGVVAYGREILSIIGPGIRSTNQVARGERFDAWEIDVGFEPGCKRTHYF